MLLTICRTRVPRHYLKRYIYTTQYYRGFIVLVPEIGEDDQSAEKIIKPNGLPHFTTITIENCLAAIGQQALAIENAVKKVESTIVANQKINASTIFSEFDDVTAPLETTWGIAKALYLGNSTLIPTKSYMNIHDRARSARASKFTNKIINDKIEEIFEKEHSSLDSELTRVIQKYLLEGKLNGLNLTKESKDELREVLSNMSKERAIFKNKVNMAVKSFSRNIHDYNLVRDFPPSLLENIAKDHNQPAKGPWKISLQSQIVNNFLKYCPDRTERWNIWQANVRKCSGQFERSLETSTHLEKIRSLRQKQANILGYPSFAVMSMQTKMVRTVENAKGVFAKLLQYAGPAQSVEIENLQRFALDSGFEHKLDIYDILYWQRKYLRNKFDINEEFIKQYFPLPKVINGLFTLSETLFGIKIIERADAEVWQPSVKYYDVYDCDGDTSRPTGGFYLDCYSKENKHSKNSGWMVSIRNKNKSAGNTPLCALIFNFIAPINGKPYLLSLEDLRMVFKTFGTSMQHILTRAAYNDLAGISNIEWDASQTSGEVMANFLNDTETLKIISGHYASEETLPDNLISHIKVLKTSLAGYNLCQQLYYSDLDLELHQSRDFWLDVVKKLWPVYRCMPLDRRDAHPCSMTDIFSGDWAAAYFSHLYSKVIAADVYDAFINKKPTSSEDKVGKRFKETFLASGGTMSTAEVFRRFRGRDPSVEALLKSLNILHLSQTTGDY